MEISVILNFRMSAITHLEDIRFEMNNISDAVARQPLLHGGLTADLMIRIENTDRPVLSMKKQIVDVLMDSLLFMRKVRTEHPELREERCPKILIDGLFRIREAQFFLKDGNLLKFTNEDSFFEYEHRELDDWSDPDMDGRWNEMISVGLARGFDLPERGHGWPLPKFETLNDETLDRGITELAKRVIYCFGK
jgi:hypothetical protein